MFEVGQKVICVRLDGNEPPVLKKGSTYTVLETRPGCEHSGQLILTNVSIPEPHRYTSFGFCGVCGTVITHVFGFFSHKYFAPLEEKGTLSVEEVIGQIAIPEAHR